MDKPPNTGCLDVCLRVDDAARSRAFYELLGFRAVEGSESEGWVVVSNGGARLGLYEQKYMDQRSFSLNFRGGDVPEIHARLSAAGVQFSGELRITASGGASASLVDPDGHLLFFDSAVGEQNRS